MALFRDSMVCRNIVEVIVNTCFLGLLEPGESRQVSGIARVHVNQFRIPQLFERQLVSTTAYVSVEEMRGDNRRDWC